jgi:YVTN family beta-propeller protein
VSADSVSPSPTTTSETDVAASPAAGRRSRRLVRLSWAAAIGIVVLAAPAAAFGIDGGFAATHGTKVANTPQSAIGYKVGQHLAVGFHRAAGQADPPAAGDYDAYISAAGGSEVLQVDVSSDAILNAYTGADTTEGVAVTPDNSQVFIAETGQYNVIPVDVATGKEGTPIYVGAYPQDVAVSPDGSTVYATVTSGDTGPGGSNVVAVISTSTDTVTGDITVGSGPRQVIFSPDGSRAYVTTERSIDVIDTATSKVISSIPDPAGAQGIAISPDGSTLYVTNPATGRLLVINAASGRVTDQVPAGAEPYAVAITPDGSTVYVTDMNSNSVMAIDTATDHSVATIGAGSLPGSIAVTPDGSQVWVGNILTGDITVIDPATDTVAGTLISGTGTSNLDGQPLAIAFVQS